MAEPSGEYIVVTSLDLSPAFDKIEAKKTVMITQPPPDILDRRLEELESNDADLRCEAALDLANFEEEGKRVFPALLAHVDDPSEKVSLIVLEAMASYPDHLEQHTKLFLGLLNNKEKTLYLRSIAADYLGRFSPLDEEVEKALEKAAELYEMDPLGAFFVRARDWYRRRAEEEDEKE